MTEYRLVPVEPTEEILLALDGPSASGLTDFTLRTMWASALAAAPQPEQEPLAWILESCGDTFLRSTEPVKSHESERVIPLYALLAPTADDERDRLEAVKAQEVMLAQIDELNAALDFLLDNQHPANFGLDYDRAALDVNHRDEFYRAIDAWLKERG